MTHGGHPSISVIVPAYNAGATLAACLEACLHQTSQLAEVIVVDDGSTDATPRIAQDFPVHYVRQENRGPAAARNRGAAEAKGEIIAFTDADCVPRADWIEKLVSGFEENTAAVGGTYDIANPENLLARMIHEEIKLRHARFSGYVDFLGSFNVAYRKQAFDAAGGFDESFRQASGEDNDLSYRLLDAGAKLRFVEDAIVAHHHPSNLGRYLAAQFRHGFWRAKLWRKHQRRSPGDAYASREELAGIVLAPALTLTAMALAALGALGHNLPLIILAAGAAVAATTLLVPVPVRMARRSGDPHMYAFAGVKLLRESARALGFLIGFIRFAPLRKERG